MAKPTRSSLSNKLDKLVSEITRSIGFCQWNVTDNCSKLDYSKLQCAHIYSRTYKSVRWDLKNLLCLCASCHFYGHKNPLAFADFVQNYLGDYEYSALRLRATPISHNKLHDLQALYTTLKELNGKDN